MSSARSHGLLARFTDSAQLVNAVTVARRQGYARLDAYSPHPVEELTAALGIVDRRVPIIALVCAIAAGAAALALQVYASVDYPVNAGGKPVVSWPAYVVVTVAMSMIGATLGALLSMLACNGLPHPWHPLFAIPEFDAASSDGYFLCLEQVDPPFDAEAARAMLAEEGATEVWSVPA